MAEALAQAQQQADATTAQLLRSVDELGASVDRVIKQNEALEAELTRARADLATAANVTAELRARIDAAYPLALLVLDGARADLYLHGAGPSGGYEKRVQTATRLLASVWVGP